MQDREGRDGKGFASLDDFSDSKKILLLRAGGINGIVSEHVMGAAITIMILVY